MRNSTPLANLSSVYTPRRGKVDSIDLASPEFRNLNIIDDVKTKILYIIPAGYTQKRDDGLMRSDVYYSIWEQAVSLQREGELFPIGKGNHSIFLEQEPDNPYDKYAVKVSLVLGDSFPSEFLPKHFIKGEPQDIGYIPRAISRQISENIKNIKKGALVNIYAEISKRIYYARIGLFYGELIKKNVDKKHNLRRLAQILKE